MKKRTRDILEIVAYVFLGYLIAVGANKGLAFAMDTNYPVVAVVSSSMEHHEEVTYKTWFLDRKYDAEEMGKWPFEGGINKGDIVFVKGLEKDEVKLGDVIVYKFQTTEPIIHRVIKEEDGTLQTKGDNNMDVDQDDSIPPIKSEDLQGRALFRVPFLGYVKIAFMKIMGGL